MEERYYISSNKYSLRERATKLRGRVYDVVFRVLCLDGQEMQKRLCGFSSKKLAKDAYLQFVSEKCVLVKNNPLKKKKNADKGLDEPTVNDLFLPYISSLQNQNKESGIIEKIRVYENYIKPLFGDTKLRALTQEMLYRWQDELWASKNPKTNDYYSFNYLTKIRNNFSGFLSWCETRYSIPNELKKVKRPKRRSPKKEMSIWTREEFETFISVVDNEMFKAIFTMLFFTGRRKGEVLALQKDDIKKDEIIFSKTYSRKTLDGDYKITTTKNEKIGRTPISAPLRKLIDSYEFQSPFAFGGKHPIHESTLGHAFDRYIEKAGVKRIRLHDLRHSYVSLLIHLGSNLTLVADLISDSLPMVTKTYAHLYEEDKQKIISQIK